MFEFKSAKPRRDALNCVNAVDIFERRLTWKHEWKKHLTMASRKAAPKQWFSVQKSSLTCGVQAVLKAIPAPLVFFFFLLNLADPKYTRSLRGEVSSPACVRTLKCFHLDLFTPAWSQRSLKSGGRDGDGGFPPLCPSHSRHQALLCSAANQPARRRQQISSPGQGCGHLGTNQIQTSPLEDDSMCLVLRFVCLFVFLKDGGGKTF